jgi:hypothetical protein
LLKDKTVKARATTGTKNHLQVIWAREYFILLIMVQ